MPAFPRQTKPKTTTTKRRTTKHDQKTAGKIRVLKSYQPASPQQPPLQTSQNKLAALLLLLRKLCRLKKNQAALSNKTAAANKSSISTFSMKETCPPSQAQLQNPTFLLGSQGTDVCQAKKAERKQPSRQLFYIPSSFPNHQAQSCSLLIPRIHKCSPNSQLDIASCAILRHNEREKKEATITMEEGTGHVGFDG